MGSGKQESGGDADVLTEAERQAVAPRAKRAAPGGMRELLAIALPMIASHGCETAMTFTDRLFLSRLGPEYMNAAMAGGLMCFLLATFFFGLTGYTTALVAQYLGAGQPARCAVATSQALLISLAAWPLLNAGRPLYDMAFEWLRIPPEQLGPQRAYFHILLAAVGVSLLRNSLSGFFSGIGRTRIVMLSAMTALVVNVASNYVLIFGKLGLPPLGIHGAAIGTILGSVAGLGILLAAYLSREVRSEFGVVGSFRLDRDVMARLWKFGYPAGLEMGLNVMAFSTVITIFHAHGLVTATATTIMFNWDMVSFLPLLGLQVGVMSLVGRYMGAGSPETAHRAVISGLITGCCYSAGILVLFVLLPHQLVAVFQPWEESAAYVQAVPIAVFMIRLASLYVMIDAMVVVLSGALRGAGDTFWAMALSVSLHWLLVPTIFILLHVLELSPETGWTALVLTYLLFSGLFYLRYRAGKWRSIRVVDRDPEIAVAEL